MQGTAFRPSQRVTVRSVRLQADRERLQDVPNTHRLRMLASRISRARPVRRRRRCHPPDDPEPHVRGAGGASARRHEHRKTSRAHSGRRRVIGRQRRTEHGRAVTPIRLTIGRVRRLASRNVTPSRPRTDSAFIPRWSASSGSSRTACSASCTGVDTTIRASRISPPWAFGTRASPTAANRWDGWDDSPITPTTRRRET